MMPEPKAISQWRTWTGLLILGAMMVLSLWICRSWPTGPQLLSTVITGLGGLGLWLAGTHASEHIANAAASAKASVAASAAGQPPGTPVILPATPQ
jgi:4-amino-4-deoxy-L-arabinose transferase-like glycosyltransferase